MKNEEIDYKWSEIFWNKRIQSLTLCFLQKNPSRLNKQKEQQNKSGIWCKDVHVMTLSKKHSPKI